jgi:hypothetical protein
MYEALEFHCMKLGTHHHLLFQVPEADDVEDIEFPAFVYL